jgi:hypothetical protein
MELIPGETLQERLSCGSSSSTRLSTFSGGRNARGGTLAADTRALIEFGIWRKRGDEEGGV